MLKSARTFSAASTSVPDVTLYNYYICPFCSIPVSLVSSDQQFAAIFLAHDLTFVIPIENTHELCKY